MIITQQRQESKQKQAKSSKIKQNQAKSSKIKRYTVGLHR